jgi:hypothetical protein
LWSDGSPSPIHHAHGLMILARQAGDVSRAAR